MHNTQRPPVPRDGRAAARWRETQLRRRLLEGVWQTDLEQRMREQVGTQRADAWGEPSLALNVFSNTVRELSVLYDSPYQITHSMQQIDTAAISTLMRMGGIFGMMPEVQRMTLGLREQFIRPHVNSKGQLRFRSVTPDMVLAASTVDVPDSPVEIQEFRLRRIEGAAEPVWTVDYLSIADPEAPIYSVHVAGSDGRLGRDITLEILGKLCSGDAYPYRRKVRDGETMGRAVLPYILYHAKGSKDRLFDPYYWHELVDASLDIAVGHQFVLHVFRESSWPQRYIVNLEVGGASLVEHPNGSRSEIVTDPSTVLQLVSTNDGDSESYPQPLVGQWKPGADIAILESTLANMVARVATDAGIPPSDIQRLGGTARSGAAISLTNKGKRDQQRKFQPVFREPDERLIGLCAVLLNSATGSKFAEGGYTVIYQQLPLSPEELKARREEVFEMLDRALITPVDAYIELHPGTPKEVARAKIDEARAVRSAPHADTNTTTEDKEST